MNKNHKKAFTLAEVLVIFMLISVSLAAFAPLMTRKSKKKVNENCASGVEFKVVEYATPGTYTFVAPENITGLSTITLVGGGGKGHKGKIVLIDKDGNITEYVSGGGGGGGGHIVSNVELVQGESYTVIVGAGAMSGVSHGGDSKFSGTSVAEIKAEGGMNASDGSGGNGGKPQGQKGFDGGKDKAPGPGGGNPDFTIIGIAGIAGETCPESSAVCKPHGGPGSSYEKNSLSNTGFIAGMGGGGGGVQGQDHVEGAGGAGGDGYAKIEYQTRCE